MYHEGKCRSTKRAKFTPELVLKNFTVVDDVSEKFEHLDDILDKMNLEVGSLIT
jgi:hypothetical protein